MGVPVTSNRSLRVTFDEHLPSVTQPYTAIQRDAPQMATTSLAEKTNVHYLPGLGWALKAVQFDRGKTQELTSAQAGVLSLSGWLAHSSAAEFDSFRQQSLTGVTYAGGVQANGSPFIQKRVGAGDSWNASDTADVAAFPQPETSEDTVPLDRFMVWGSNHEPTDALVLTFYVPGGLLQASGPLLTFYFSGPAGSNDEAVGIGQYALKLYGDGRARLFEFDASAWTLRYKFKWSLSGTPSYSMTHEIAIVSNAFDTAGYPGNKIIIQPLASIAEEGNPVIEGLIGLALSAVRQQKAEQDGYIYRVPRKTAEPTTIGPLRIDVRRDVRVQLQVSKATYPDTGVLYDDVITLPYYPDTSEPIYLDWWGQVPTGTVMTASLFDATTGVELTGETPTITDNRGGQKYYTLNERQRHYRVRVEFESDSTNTKTPLLEHINLTRVATFDTPDITPVTSPQQGSSPSLVRHTPRRIDIEGDGLDNGGRGADFEFEDTFGELEELTNRGGIPVKIDTTYDSGGTNRSVLFRGYIDAAEGGRVTGGNKYGGKDRRKYDIAASGEWKRLQEAIVPQRYAWFDPITSQASKVTDIIATLIGTAYPSSMIAIPDRSIRLWSQSQDSYITEPGGRVLDVVTQLARDYLGAQVIFDENAGTNGKWRLLEPKVTPYISVAKFYQSHPGNGLIAAHDNSYGTTVVGDQTVVNTFIRKGTYQRHQERPEGNMVTVIGTAVGADAASQGAAAARLSQVAVNVNSFNVFNLGSSDAGYPDGTHPDFIGRYVPIIVVDSTLTTQAGVDWVCRRVFDYACHARTVITFEAPLILITDSTDDEQTNPRPLRAYDVVEVEEYDGTFAEYVVASVSMHIEKAHISMATYTVIRPSNMDEKVTLPTSKSIAAGFIRKAQQFTGFGLQSNVNSTNNRDLKIDNLMVMPELPATPLQDLDPTSGTYGEFYFMLDYDPIP